MTYSKNPEAVKLYVLKSLVNLGANCILLVEGLPLNHDFQSHSSVLSVLEYPVSVPTTVQMFM